MKRAAVAAAGLLLAVGCGQSDVPSSSIAPTTATPGPVTSAPEASPAPLGPITFMRFKDDDEPEVWAACGGLDNARQLTATEGRGSGYPAWSPDVSRIAFDSDRDDQDLDDDAVINDIYTMAADGSDVRKLTASNEFASDPAYSPDGTLIAYGGGDDGDTATAGIYLINAADGSGRRRLTSLPEGWSRDLAPRFSPDGTRIVFTRESNSADNSIYIVGTDGSSLTQLPTTDMNPGDASWSADGSRLVFEADAPGFPYGSIWVIGIDGSGLANLLPLPSAPDATDGYADPAYSPDGKQIVLLHGLFEGGGQTEGMALVNADGTGLHYVGDGTGGEHQPDWGRATC
jgi:Tol biopolymer transport system component